MIWAQVALRTSAQHFENGEDVGDRNEGSTVSAVTTPRADASVPTDGRKVGGVSVANLQALLSPSDELRQLWRHEIGSEGSLTYTMYSDMSGLMGAAPPARARRTR
jgi:hypothetical protein